MKRTLLSLLFAGMFAVAGTASAQNVSPDEREKAGDQATNPDAAKDAKKSDSSTTGTDDTSAKAKAEADYTAAKAKCDDMQGDAKSTCLSDAKRARSEALAMAKSKQQ